MLDLTLFDERVHTMQRSSQRFRGLAGWIGLAAICLFMISCFQRRLIYFPERASEAVLKEMAAQSGLEPWRDSAGEIIGWKKTAKEAPRSRLLVFHGNAGHAVYRAYFANLPPDGWEVRILEYPGYGAREGAPSEKRFKSAALEAFDALTGPEEPPVFLLGESIGTGVASWVAGQRPDSVAGVILVTPMTSLPDVGASHYPFLPVRLLLSERYDSGKALERYRGPVAFVVAGGDRVIPPRLGRRLFETYGGRKRLWEQEGAGHNTVNYAKNWWPPVFSFLLEPEESESVAP